MKNLYALLVISLISTGLLSQPPQKMSYQAVIRNSSDPLVTNHVVGIRVSILHGSATGTPVYVETQTPTTNANGLVTIEIGSGTPVTGTFDGIVWYAGSFFIKTETDPTGGTNYSMTGTSQLLSVPYALSAKTVTTNANLTGEVTSIGNITSITNSAVIGKVLTGFTSGAGTVVATDNILQAIQKLNGNNPVHYIGESYGGGIVFYVYDNGKHGLIAATADQSTGIRWYGGSFTNTRARADGVGAGFKNTVIIIANQGPVDGNVFAATVCNEYSVTVGGVTYGDWYLPSKHELNLLYLQKSVVGGFDIYPYWSSNEYNNLNAWTQNFNGGDQNYSGKGYINSMRAVRAF
jgi:hypothetical protein